MKLHDLEGTRHLTAVWHGRRYAPGGSGSPPPLADGHNLRSNVCVLLVLDGHRYWFESTTDTGPSREFLDGTCLHSINVLSSSLLLEEASEFVVGLVRPAPKVEFVDMLVELRMRVNHCEEEHEILYATNEATGLVVLEIGTNYWDTLDFVFEWDPAGDTPSWFQDVDPDPPVLITKKPCMPEFKRTHTAKLGTGKRGSRQWPRS